MLNFTAYKNNAISTFLVCFFIGEVLFRIYYLLKNNSINLNKIIRFDIIIHFIFSLIIGIYIILYLF